jgi:hypothetical protein
MGSLFGGDKKKTTTSGTETTTRNVDAFRAIQVPNASELQAQLTRAVLAGQITPQEADVILQERTELEGLQVDPALEEAQYESLARLQALASQGGLDDIDRNKILQIYDNMTQTARAGREAAATKAKAQGTYGSGLAYLDQQMANQDASQQANRFQAQVAADAAERKNQAIRDSATLATGIRDQSWNEQAQVAAAQDAINKFNTQNRIDTQQGNIDRNLQAQIANQQNQQSVNNKNADIANQETLYNRAARQQQFENEMARAKELSNARVTTTSTGSGTSKGSSGQDTANTIGSIASIIGAFYSDEEKKENIERTTSDDIDDFLDHITGYEFNYKPEVRQGGRHMGVMAQDLERTPEGRSVVIDTEGGKMVDGGKLASIAMAVVSDLNKRVRQLEGK